MKKFLLFLAIITSPAFADNVLDTQTNVYGSASTTPGLYMGRGRGTSANPEQLFSSDVITGLYGNGFKPSGITTNIPVSIQFQASENWSNTAAGTKIIFNATPATTLTPVAALTITGTSLSIGTTNFAIPVHAAPYAASTPTVAGQLIYNSTQKELCLSTGTAIYQWVLAASPATKCTN